MPLDEIKIDRAFVSALDDNEGNRAMVTTILNMAAILRLNIVAEGVETPAQRDFLLQHGCQIFQGHLYTRPLPREDFEAYCRAHARTQPDAGSRT